MKRSKATAASSTKAAAATATTTSRAAGASAGEKTGPIQFRRKAPNFKFNSPLLLHFGTHRIASASVLVFLILNLFLCIFVL